MNIIPVLIASAILLVPAFTGTAESVKTDPFEQFENWAKENGIELVGVNKNSFDLYYDGYVPETDYVSWKRIPNVLVAAEVLYKIPQDVIQVMDGKTLYFSTEYGRSYAVLGSFPSYGILEGLEPGIILEQNINPHTVIHELGHIVDYHGIQGIYGDDQNIFNHLSEDRSSIFKVTQKYHPRSTTPPNGYISVYSTANDAENFAENFAYYVQYPNEFRERLVEDPLLIEEYEFLRDKIFSGLEF